MIRRARTVVAVVCTASVSSVAAGIVDKTGGTLRTGNGDKNWTTWR